MRIPSNKISDVTRFFHSELGSIYPKSEIDVFVAISFGEILGISKAGLLLKNEETMSESEMLKFTGVIRQLKDQRPIQYIFGKADFCGMKFEVNEHVLIPRPETEELVEWIKQDAQAPTTGNQRPTTILDIGTGSGCIAIALKKHFMDADVSALDVSEKALEVAKRNAGRNSVRVNFIHSDILSGSSHVSPGKFDIVVSNPPYVRESEKENMQQNVLGHEPHLALFVKDDDALFFYKAIVSFAKEQLNKMGKLYFEINETSGNEVKMLMERSGFVEVEVKKDLSGKERMVRGVLV